jgi:hypothetical protein
LHTNILLGKNRITILQTGYFNVHKYVRFVNPSFKRASLMGVVSDHIFEIDGWIGCPGRLLSQLPNGAF